MLPVAPEDRGDDGLRIEPVTPDRVGALLGFLAAAYADQPAAADLFVGERGMARWRWLYEQYPVRQDGRLPAWICLEGERIVGHVGALPVEVVVRGELKEMAWARDLIVAPSMRGRGIGTKLMRLLPDTFERGGVLGYEDTYGLYRRIGYEEVGTLPVFLNVRRSQAFAAAFIPSRAARPLVRVLLRLAQARPPAWGSHGVSIERLADFDGRFDELWRSIEPALGCVVKRTSETMRWRYLRNPTTRYQVLAALRGPDLRGVAVVRTGSSHGVPVGIVVEVLAHPADHGTIRALIDGAERTLREGLAEPPVFLRAAVRNGPLGRALLRAGYLPSPSRIHLIVAGRHGRASVEGMLAADDWYLNAGDSDLDFL